MVSRGFLLAMMATLWAFALQMDEAAPQQASSTQVKALVENLKDKDWQIRWYAVSSLGEMRERGAVDPLISVLKSDPNGYVRAMAAWALGQIGDQRGVSPLIDALADESYDVRKRALDALKQITGKDFGQDQGRWRSWWLSEKR
jgi:HEAT repeat protein